MMRFVRERNNLLSCLLLTSLLLGCKTVNSISISQTPEEPQRKGLIKSQASAPIILSIPFNTDFVEEARADLLEQCPKGAIEGVLTKHQYVNYFIGLVMSQQIEMQGYCLATKRQGKGKNG